MNTGNADDAAVYELEELLNQFLSNLDTNSAPCSPTEITEDCDLTSLNEEEEFLANIITIFKDCALVIDEYLGEFSKQPLLEKPFYDDDDLENTENELPDILKSVGQVEQEKIGNKDFYHLSNDKSENIHEKNSIFFLDLMVLANGLAKKLFSIEDINEQEITDTFNYFCQSKKLEPNKICLEISDFILLEIESQEDSQQKEKAVKIAKLWNEYRQKVGNNAVVINPPAKTALTYWEIFCNFFLCAANTVIWVVSLGRRESFFKYYTKEQNQGVHCVYS